MVRARQLSSPNEERAEAKDAGRRRAADRSSSFALETNVRTSAQQGAAIIDRGRQLSVLAPGQARSNAQKLPAATGKARLCAEAGRRFSRIRFTQTAAGHFPAVSERQSHMNRMPVSGRLSGPAIDPSATVATSDWSPRSSQWPTLIWRFWRSQRCIPPPECSRP